MLAESWRRIDPRTVELSLRKGVKFHEGGDFTAEDVAFTFDAQGITGDGSGALFPEKVIAAARNIFSTLDRVEVVDAHTVRLVARTPDIVLEQRLARQAMEIHSKQAFLKAADYAAYSRAPVGTGPFRVREFDADRHLILDAHADYWGGLPNTDRVTFRVVPETSSRVNGLLNDEFDLITNLPPDQVDIVGQNAGLETLGDVIDGQLFLQLVKNDKPLADPRIRQAISHAIDRQLIVDTLWAGRTIVPQGRQFKSYGDMFIEDWQNPAYDPEKARALLAEAGYAGEPIPFRVQNDYYPMQVATAQVLVDMLSQVGLNVEIQMVESGAKMQDKATPRGMREWSNAAQFGDPIGSLLVQQGKGGLVRVNDEWSNDQFDAKSEILVSGTDPAARKAAFRRMLGIVEVEDPSYVMLHQLASFYATRGGFEWQPGTGRALDFRADNLIFKSLDRWRTE
ncbi:ABC transporter substrate-binding protein [Amaricoccus macauensis]|uniref:ABC transporter substrate-binding protein n=1 Tax=Amaricoccus macauensis TaxID=57001 RepID=UPI0016138ED0